MLIRKKILSEIIQSYRIETLFWGKVPYLMELYSADTLAKLLAVPLFYFYGWDYKVYLALANSLSAASSLIINKSKVYFLMAFIAAASVFTVYISDYVEWSILLLFLGFRWTSQNWRRLVPEVISLCKFCLPLLMLVKYEPQLGKYVLCLLPEILLLSSGARQVDKGFIMRFRSDKIVESFLSGDCVTFSVLHCLHNNVDRVDLKRVGDKFHVRPGKAVKLSTFLSFYFSGFYLSNKKLTLEEKILSMFDKKSYFETNFYTSLMWSLFERQGYVKDFKTFEKIIASFHPKFSQFRLKLQKNSVDVSPDTAKRVVYYVFKSTNVDLPNWGNYTPAKVDVKFVKPLKEDVSQSSEQSSVYGKQGETICIEDSSGFPSIHINLDYKVDTVITTVSKKTVRRVAKVYSLTDFKKSGKQGTQLTYKKLVNVPRLFMCQSCFDTALDSNAIDSEESKSKVQILPGHKKNCQASLKKLAKVKKVLRPKVVTEYEYNTSPIDKFFMKRRFTQKSLQKNLNKIPMSKFECQKRHVRKANREYTEKTVRLVEPISREKYHRCDITLSEIVAFAKDDMCSSIHIACLKSDIDIKSKSNEKSRSKSFARFMRQIDDLQKIIEFDIPLDELAKLMQ
jgi:hypothetical protein